MSKIRDNRLKCELQDLQQNYPKLKVEVYPQNFYIWYISFQGAEKTLYENENFKLRFEFLDTYVRKKYN